MLSYNIVKERVKKVKEFIDKRDIKAAQKEIAKLQKYLEESVKDIIEILNYLENGEIKIKKKIYSLIYGYLYEIEVMDEDGIFARVIDHFDNKEFVKESLWEQIKNHKIKLLEEEINKVEKILNLLDLIFRFLDYKINKCGAKVELHEINKALEKLNKS